MKLATLFALTCIEFSTVKSFAAASASDTASNYAPSSWSTNPPNLGSGFGPWVLGLRNNNPPYVGTFLDTSSSVTTGGYSWGTYANGGTNGAISILRPFTVGPSGTRNLYNQTFSVELSSGGIGNGSGGPPNSELQVAIGSAITFTYYGTNTDNFLFQVGSGPTTTTPVNFAELRAGLLVSLSVGPWSGKENFTFDVTPVSGGSPLYMTSGTFNGFALAEANFSFLDSNTTGNCYFNNLNITPEVPEPSTVSLCGIALPLLLLRLLRLYPRNP